MLVVCFRVGMTGRTSENSIVVGVCMTGRTIIPCAFVGSAVYREIQRVMILKFRRLPPWICGVAFSACRSEVYGLVIGIKACQVIPFVTGYTFGRNLGIISTRVALCTFVYVVSLCKWKEVVVDPCTLPFKCIYCVAFNTIGGKARLGVLWIGGRFEV